MTREDLQDAANWFAQRLDLAMREAFGEKVGFLIFLFDFADRQADGKHGNVAYISNAQRQDIIALLDEIKGNLEAGLTTEPPGPRATS